MIIVIIMIIIIIIIIIIIFIIIIIIIINCLLLNAIMIGHINRITGPSLDLGLERGWCLLDG